MRCVRRVGKSRTKGFALFALSLLLLLAGGASYVGAMYLSYRFDDVARAHMLFTLACVAVFLLALALALIGSTGPDGRMRRVDTLPKLVSWGGDGTTFGHRARSFSAL